MLKKQKRSFNYKKNNFTSAKYYKNGALNVSDHTNTLRVCIQH